METNNQNNKTPHPEETGKVPKSGVMSETYKEDVNPQDELGNANGDPEDPEESKKAKEDLESYPLEEADTSEEDMEKERFRNGEFNRDDKEDENPSTNDSEFLK